MPLTNQDIERIKGSGKSDFYHEDSHQLRNIDGRCFFLTEGGDCTIYEIRPEGCRFYPLIMALPHREAILDEECPYADEFMIVSEDIVSLNGLVDKLLEEEQ